MIPKSVCMAALLAFAALSSAAQDAGTEEDGGPMSIVFVLDSSGSMWGKIGETFKRDIAMEALSNIAGEMPEWSKGADCKSAGVRLRRFKSFSPHNHASVVQW